MPRDGSMTPGDLIGRLHVLRVECARCGRAGRYGVERLAAMIGADGKLTDWLYGLTADCSRRHLGNLSDRCAARCPDLLTLVPERYRSFEWRLGFARAGHGSSLL